MKNLFKHIILFVSVSIFGLNAGYAQVYPVQLTPVFNSPYSVKLSDYATSMDTKMRLMINPVDITISNRQVRLKLSIKGNGLNIQSSDYVQGQQPIFINGGEFLTLTNTDLAALFRLENLQGISALQYANGLPEGMYDFCFEMYDFVTNQRISQKSCAMMYLQLNDPPLLNTPRKNEQIAATDFPNILFTWTPRNINATNVSYKFELKQLMDPTMDPQFAFQMSPILYEETLFGSALMYNLNMPILTPGMRYAWRVRAISTTGLSENSIFKNDGYSEIYSFKYTASCAAPTFLLSEAQSPTSVKLSWQGVPEHTRYQIQYKKQDVHNAQWFSSNSLNTQSLITNLEPGVTYQFRVGSSCDPATDGIQSFTYSGISTFTTPTQTNGVQAYNCGIIPKINIQNQKPLTNLIVSETFTAGDFPVTVLELKGENSPYSGRGYIIVPYLADTKIAVEFNSITVNTDYQLISGVVETSYNPDWKNVTDVEDFTGEGQGGQIEEEVPFEIKDIVIDANGDIVVNGKDGEQVTIPGGKDTVITDGSGKVYPIDSKGNGSNEGMAAATGGKSTPANTDGVDKNGQATEFTAKGISIAFSPESNSKYAFDALPDNLDNIPASLQNLYKKVGKKPLPYKAVLNGDTDTLLANVTVTDANIKLDSIVFKTQNGARIDSKRSDKVFVLTVKGNQTYAEEQILATIKQGDKWKVIGAFMLVHISPKDVNVVLVPLNSATQIPANAEENLEKIYRKVGVKLNITRSEKVDYSDTDGKIEVEDSDFLANYTSDEQSINSKIKNSPNYKIDAYYLIYSDLQPSKELYGFMALKGQFGYIFPKASFNTDAHELGHGAFGLEHPFKTDADKGKTNFLMDYANGTVLWHNDWKQINDPKFKLYLFQEDSEGEFPAWYLITLFKKLKHARQTNTIYTFKSPVKGETRILSSTNLNGYNFEKIYFQIVPNSKQIDATKIKDYKKTNSDGTTLFGLEIDSQIFIAVQKDEFPKLKEYFESTKPENFILFVNGFVPTKTANNDEVWENDKIDYWNKIDDSFINKINKNSHVIYADGNKNIDTSNHIGECSFAKSYTSVEKTKGALVNIFLPSITALCTSTTAKPYHNTKPNVSGFEIRKNMGRTAGNDFVNKLKDGIISSSKRIVNGKIVIDGTVDVVAHSMGFAYSLGMIEVLKKAGITIGNYYVLAPENACSGNAPVIAGKIYQYGSDEKNDPFDLQDGVAPQCRIDDKVVRVYIPIEKRPKDKLGFLESHSVDNYDWIFDEKIIQKGEKGYVIPRN